MAEKMSFTESLQRFRIVNQINYYLEDRPKHNLYHTTELVLLYLNDKISSEEKRERMYEEISELENDINTFVRENVRDITKKTREEAFQCAKSHLEKLRDLSTEILENNLETDLEYWCMISDMRGMETVYQYDLPNKKNNLDLISLTQLGNLALEMWGMDVKITLDEGEKGD